MALRDDSYIARQLHRTPLTIGAYCLDKGVLLEDFFHFPPQLAALNPINYSQLFSFKAQRVITRQRAYTRDTIYSGMQANNIIN
jgi:hypothetical protein